MGGAVGCVVGGGGDGGEHVKFVKVVTVECASSLLNLKFIGRAHGI